MMVIKEKLQDVLLFPFLITSTSRLITELNKTITVRFTFFI